jgi:hypothetical protein
MTQANLGALKISWNLKPLITEGTAFGQLITDLEYQNAVKNPRQKDGVLKIQLHNVEQLPDPKSQYSVDF